MIYVVYYVSLETDLAHLIISKRLWPIMIIQSSLSIKHQLEKVLMSHNDIFIKFPFKK